MRTTLRLLIIGLSSITLAACSGKEEADKMTKLADQICACATVECAQKVLPEIQKFTEANAGKEVDEKQADRYNAQVTRTEKCIEALAAKAEKEGKKE